MKKIILPIIILAVAALGAFLILNKGLQDSPSIDWEEYSINEGDITFEYPSEWIVRERESFFVFIAPSGDTPELQSPISIDARGDVTYDDARAQLGTILVDSEETPVETHGVPGVQLVANVQISEFGEIPVVSTILNYNGQAVVINLSGFDTVSFEENRVIYLHIIDSLIINTIPEPPEPLSAENLEITEIVPGDGAEAKSGDTLVVHYTGTLGNGEKFDSSLDRGEPFTFVLGSGQVIPGWDMGLAGMRVGGKRKLVIPPELAYGEQERGPIPPNSTLIFEVELLEIK